MQTYTFTNADGKAQEIAVTDEVYTTIQELDKKDYANERKHKRKRISLEKAVDNGWDVADPNANIETIIDKKERYKKLYAALNALPKYQQKLIYLVFFKGISQQDIAAQEGVVKCSISKRLTRIMKKLKKYLN